MSDSSGTFAAPSYPVWRRVALVLGPVAGFAAVLVPHPEALSPEAWRLTGLVAWMVIWWLSEALSPVVTALIPVPMMPLLGIAEQKTVTASYAHPLIFLFLGGFMIAAAMQRWGLHKRIALTIVSRMGSDPQRIVAGFMLATAFLSMWISNTATAIMMFAVGLSLLEHLGEHDISKEELARFGKALMLGIAYAASIGGVATLIGTPPNALLSGFMEASYGRSLNFASWMLVGVPLAAVMLPAAMFWLTRVMFPLQSINMESASPMIRRELKELGPMGQAERMVLWVFVLTAFAWITRRWLAGLTGLSISDTTIAVGAALVLFVMPLSLKKGQFVLDWESAVKIPWGVLILFGGGLSLAGAFKSTGLSEAIGHGVAGLSGVSPFVLLIVVTTVVVLLTELTSNTATTAAFLPVMGAVAIGMKIDPLLLCAPVALSASMAFMLPVATPPNAIVFGYRELTVGDMARAGTVMNIASVILIACAVYLLGPIFLGVELP